MAAVPVYVRRIAGLLDVFDRLEDYPDGVALDVLAAECGISADQLHRSLGLDYKSAWFMAHRLREAMRDGGLLPPMGAEGEIEADETYYGKVEEERPRNKYLPPPTKGRRTGPAGKRAIV